MVLHSKSLWTLEMAWNASPVWSHPNVFIRQGPHYRMHPRASVIYWCYFGNDSYLRSHWQPTTLAAGHLVSPFFFLFFGEYNLCSLSSTTPLVLDTPTTHKVRLIASMPQGIDIGFAGIRLEVPVFYLKGTFGKLPSCRPQGFLGIVHIRLPFGEKYIGAGGCFWMWYKLWLDEWIKITSFVDVFSKALLGLTRPPHCVLGMHLTPPFFHEWGNLLHYTRRLRHSSPKPLAPHFPHDSWYTLIPIPAFPNICIVISGCGFTSGIPAE